MANESDYGYYPERHAGVTAEMQKQGLLKTGFALFDRAERVMIRGLGFYYLHYCAPRFTDLMFKTYEYHLEALLSTSHTHSDGHMILLEYDCKTVNIESMEKDELIGIVSGGVLPSEVVFGGHQTLTAYVVALRGRRVVFRADGFSPESMPGLEQLVRWVEKESSKDAKSS
ncbi:hypothetical protein HYY73_04225 [Candidatus Woesearchaeota archaeon]|nr:hypothetical protein [Candidatus Woesearchaeota archaeon]